MCGCLCDERSLFAEAFCIGYAVVTVIGSAKSGEFVRVRHPVEIAGINNASAHSGTVTVHIFCCGVGNDIRAPFKRTATHGSCKGVVDNKGYSVSVCGFCKFFNIKNGEGGICDCFTENRLCIGAECGIEFLLGTVGGNECEINAHFLHCNCEKIVGSAVDCGGRNNVVAAGCDIENRIE